MKLIGKVEILDSFYVTNRGLVARCNLIEGRVKKGSLVNLELGDRKTEIRIDSVEMIDNISKQEYWIGLLFNYNEESKELMNAKLQYQIVDIFEEN